MSKDPIALTARFLEAANRQVGQAYKGDRLRWVWKTADMPVDSTPSYPWPDCPDFTHRDQLGRVVETVRESSAGWALSEYANESLGASVAITEMVPTLIPGQTHKKHPHTTVMEAEDDNPGTALMLAFIRAKGLELPEGWA